MKIGERIRQVRQLKSLTAKDLAKRSGLSPSAISRLESEEDRDPRTHSLIGIAQALEVSTDFLAGREDQDIELHVAVRRQSLRRFLRTNAVPDETAKGLEELCFKDSGLKSEKEWQDFIENHTHMVARGSAQ